MTEEEKLIIRQETLIDIRREFFSSKTKEEIGDHIDKLVTQNNRRLDTFIKITI